MCVLIFKIPERYKKDCNNILLNKALCGKFSKELFVETPKFVDLPISFKSIIKGHAMTLYYCTNSNCYKFYYNVKRIHTPTQFKKPGILASSDGLSQSFPEPFAPSPVKDRRLRVRDCLASSLNTNKSLHCHDQPINRERARETKAMGRFKYLIE